MTDLSPQEMVIALHQHCREDEGGCLLWRGSMIGRRPRTYIFDRNAGHYPRRVVWQANTKKPLARKQFILLTCGEDRCLKFEHMRLGGMSAVQTASYAAGRHPPWTYADTVRIIHARKGMKLNRDKARQIRERAGAGDLHKDIAAAFGISRSMTSQVIRGDWWIDPSSVFSGNPV